MNVHDVAREGLKALTLGMFADKLAERPSDQPTCSDLRGMMWMLLNIVLEDQSVDPDLRLQAIGALDEAESIGAVIDKLEVAKGAKLADDDHLIVDEAESIHEAMRILRKLYPAYFDVRLSA